MTKKFLLASGNPRKAEEFRTLFDSDAIEIAPADKSLNVDETGVSFHENAYLKAKAYFDHFKMPVVSDDSGIVVDALPDELGIYSARFGGEGLSDQQRALLLIEKMRPYSKKQDRSAHFLCVLCFYLSNEEIYYFEGRMQGHVSEVYAGEHGFGYDPVFRPEGPHEDKTVAMVPEWKAKNSHRALACFHANNFFKERDCHI